jgi:hypothetical protein
VLNPESAGGATPLSIIPQGRPPCQVAFCTKMPPNLCAILHLVFFCQFAIIVSVKGITNEIETPNKKIKKIKKKY